MTDRPLEEWAVSRALFPMRLIQDDFLNRFRCLEKDMKKDENESDFENLLGQRNDSVR